MCITILPGRVHDAQVYIEGKSVTASFNIIEDKDEVKIKFKVVIRFGRDEHEDEDEDEDKVDIRFGRDMLVKNSWIVATVGNRCVMGLGAKPWGFWGHIDTN